ncbi:hypothetical protein CJ178_19000 [Rhodococcus sp. ACPA4]|jgi:hypothetical protein|uniref:Uncharacterized protein n=1 Tax=Nocardia globerula TaxID=1818 RepID=A0A652YR94_NOCGL|nr:MULTISPECIES: DUF6292 family protein [Rhodococcus]NMD63337.1 hypothetical protein [Nocardia globerula]KJF24522.1 hypothetical protein SZ00_01443 [Rhodococcus sp. AD45]MCE4268956.1 hypothetical protein [Rhodococcus globerulus]NRI68449.1 hypothetical protein [Rhodococcus sp. MS16]PBC43401.1 hypothetical protein CJ178_19000 [Rhodococcus sp. ACPA4]
MRAHTAIPSESTCQRYVVAVAASAFAESVIWFDGPAFDAVLVLGNEIPQHSGHRAVLAWNHYFGWALGVEDMPDASFTVVECLGIGRMPDPDLCADRVVELIAQASS